MYMYRIKIKNVTTVQIFKLRQEKPAFCIHEHVCKKMAQISYASLKADQYFCFLLNSLVYNPKFQASSKLLQQAGLRQRWSETLQTGLLMTMLSF